MVKKVWSSDKEYELVPEEIKGNNTGSVAEGNYTYKGVSLSDEENNRWPEALENEDPLSIWKAGVDATVRQFGIDE
jgi:hypothetical protein